MVKLNMEKMCINQLKQFGRMGSRIREAITFEKREREKKICY
jgi:hypothetical protein